MNCNNTPKCDKPCGDCPPERRPIPEGSEYGDQPKTHIMTTYRLLDEDEAKAAQCPPGHTLIAVQFIEKVRNDQQVECSYAYSNGSDGARPAVRMFVQGELIFDYANPALSDDLAAAMWRAFQAGRTSLPAVAQSPAEGAWTDDQIDALMPEPDGCAQDNIVRVEVLPGLMGTEFEEVDAWSRPLVRQAVRAALAASQAQPKHTDEPLFLLHCGQIDSGGEQGDWDIEADSGKRVEEFCRLHPGQTVNLYPHVQYPAVKAEDSQDAARYRFLRGAKLWPVPGNEYTAGLCVDLWGEDGAGEQMGGPALDDAVDAAMAAQGVFDVPVQGSES